MQLDLASVANQQRIHTAPDTAQHVHIGIADKKGLRWLHFEAPQNLTGKFFRDRKVIPW